MWWRKGMQNCDKVSDRMQLLQCCPLNWKFPIYAENILKILWSCSRRYVIVELAHSPFNLLGLAHSPFNLLALPEPLLVLELCDQTLKEWLTKLAKHKIQDEDEDNMINFACHIAKAMAHLHQNEVYTCHSHKVDSKCKVGWGVHCVHCNFFPLTSFKF